MGANHAITEPATWDAAAPVVPDSDADMDDAPAVIDAFVTKLGKRTQWLYAAIAALPNFGLFGRKDTVNTWTQPQTIATLQGDTQVNGNMFATGDAHGHQVLSDTYVHATTDLQADGKLEVHGSATSAIDHDLTVGGALTVTGAVAAASVSSTGIVTGSDHRYATRQQHTIEVCIGPGDGWFMTPEGFAVARRPASVAANSATISSRIIPLKMPSGAWLKTIDVLYQQAGAATDNDLFELLDCPTTWAGGSSPPVPTVTVPPQYAMLPVTGRDVPVYNFLDVRAAARDVSSDPTLPGLFINNESASYKLRWTPGEAVELANNLSGGSILYRLRLTVLLDNVSSI